MSKNIFIACLISSAVCVISTETYAAVLEISSGIYYFNYEEFSQSGTSLDSEKGYLPGIKIIFSQLHNGNKYSAHASVYSGTVDYSGGTQSGQPHTTKTEQQLTQFGFEFISKQIELIPVQLNIGIKRWEWDRNILDRNNVQGLHEIYNWDEISIGLNFETKQYNNAFYWGNINALYTLSPVIEILLDTSTAKLTMGEKPGFRLRAGKTWILNNQNRYSLSIISEYWQFGRSNSVFIADFFGNPAFITEPDSTSFHTRLEFSYTAYF
ncbi:hypothetical protein MNBD_GAMMA09-1386 [hydrothermal vent metagenome]|uniref:Outer membrane protein beta-barrel domain-containing protein n=1 Tax=hydrothermal vent metagenome TaxID=652676 RepID=A0A3B0XME1_9ZZZZ